MVILITLNHIMQYHALTTGDLPDHPTNNLTDIKSGLKTAFSRVFCSMEELVLHYFQEIPISPHPRPTKS